MRSRAWRRHQYQRSKSRVVTMMSIDSDWVTWQTPREIGKRVATRRFCCHSPGCTEEARRDKVKDRHRRRNENKKRILSWLQELYFSS